MATDGNGEVEYCVWQTVGKGGQKRGASKERPEMTEAGGDNKLWKMGSLNYKELVLLFRVKVQKPWTGRVWVTNPLKSHCCFRKSNGDGLLDQDFVKWNLEGFCINQKQFDRIIEVGKLVRISRKFWITLK